MEFYCNCMYLKNLALILKYFNCFEIIKEENELFFSKY